MTERVHVYSTTLEWTGDRGAGTASYTGYARDHRIGADGKPDILGSSDPAFRGDATRWNPEELLVASLSACHQLWFLHLCAAAKVVVTAYVDTASGEMVETADGSGAFRQVTLRPHVVVTNESDVERATALHHQAHAMCFIARSVSFAVSCEPVVSGPAG